MVANAEKLRLVIRAASNIPSVRKIGLCLELRLSIPNKVTVGYDLFL